MPMKLRPPVLQDVPPLLALGVPGATHVLEKDGKMIGAAACADNACSAFVIDTQWRRRGYGTFLMKTLLRTAPQGFALLVAADNEAGQAFCARFGFEPDDDALAVLAARADCLAFSQETEAAAAPESAADAAMPGSAPTRENAAQAFFQRVVSAVNSVTSAGGASAVNAASTGNVANAAALSGAVTAATPIGQAELRSDSPAIAASAQPLSPQASVQDGSGTGNTSDARDGAPHTAPQTALHAVPHTAHSDGEPARASAPLLRFVRRPLPAISALSVAHSFLMQYGRRGGVAIDATAGNGQDTLFLARLVGETGRVLALDIQPEAVTSTGAAVANGGCAGWVRIVCDSHENLALYAEPGSVDMVVFNLGYLPGGDRSVFTTPDTSVPAIAQALRLLRRGGVLTACVYAGGLQGTQERDAVLAYFRSLHPGEYTVLITEFAGRSETQAIPVCVQKQ